MSWSHPCFGDDELGRTVDSAPRNGVLTLGGVPYFWIHRGPPHQPYPNIRGTAAYVDEVGFEFNYTAQTTGSLQVAVSLTSGGLKGGATCVVDARGTILAWTGCRSGILTSGPLQVTAGEVVKVRFYAFIERDIYPLDWRHFEVIAPEVTLTEF